MINTMFKHILESFLFSYHYFTLNQSVNMTLGFEFAHV